LTDLAAVRIAGIESLASAAAMPSAKFHWACKVDAQSFLQLVGDYGDSMPIAMIVI
jgi:hypothetical protein